MKKRDENGRKNRTLIFFFGVCAIFAGILLLAVANDSVRFSAMFFESLAMLLVGLLAIFYMATSGKFTAKRFFLSCVLLLSALLSQIVNSLQAVPPLRQIWPLFLAIASISLFSTGIVLARALKRNFVVPAAAMLILSVFFSLFSFKIVKKPLLKFFYDFWPIIFIIFGGYLVALFFMQNARQKK